MRLLTGLVFSSVMHNKADYGKRWYRILRSLLRKELTLGNVVRGYRDFKRGIVGKVDL